MNDLEERYNEIPRCNYGRECADWHGICPDNLAAFIKSEVCRALLEVKLKRAEDIASLDKTYSRGFAEGWDRAVDAIELKKSEYLSKL